MPVILQIFKSNKHAFYVCITFCIFSAALSACSSSQTNTIPNNVDFEIIESPHVTVNIKLSKDTFAIDETRDIGINIKLTNDSSAAQEVLFDQMHVSTGGPWWTSAKVVDIKTNQSVLQNENAGILSSQTYSTKELKAKSYQLAAGKSIEKEYKLTNIVVYKNNKLSPGTYAVQLFYQNNTSNQVTFTVK